MAGDQEANEILTTRFPDIQPGNSAASNQRAAFLKLPRVAVGCSHSVDVNLPAAKSHTCLDESVVYKRPVHAGNVT